MAQPLPDGCYLLQLAGVGDRTAAEALQGTKVFVRRDELDALDEDEVYLADLPGMMVRTVVGEELGRISRILDLNGNTLLCIAGLMGAEVLLPAVPQVLRSVDMVGGVVVVDPPDGLLSV
jgi:16S rRNA processing protein RimM